MSLKTDGHQLVKQETRSYFSMHNHMKLEGYCLLCVFFFFNFA